MRDGGYTSKIDKKEDQRTRRISGQGIRKIFSTQVAPNYGPDDHIVAATGVLQNAQVVLTAQRQRLTEAKTAKSHLLW
ncbi:MAG TPA: hypothetical protein VES69_09175 [Pyrinomonadaceae bacterium]|nr:hypothetical protein [Pyrinomonadaceae bacterium]